MKIKGIIHGVFTEANFGMFKPYDQFILIDEELGLTMSDDTKELIAEYYNKVIAIQDKLNNLSNLEELIMIARARDNVSNVTLFVIKTYIYARTTCYRSDTINQEVRAIVGSTTTDGTDLNQLLKNPEFMAKTEAKLKTAVENLYNLKLKTFNKVKTNA
jgi:hypothetical protein